MNSQNREKVVLNIFSGDLQFLNDLEMGFSVRNLLKAPFYVRPGYTRTYPNLSIPQDLDVEVQEDGELIVF